ncbi:hypothetical protein FIV42_24685 [Persicimonas caeni]|uniref:Uncharacterized protein n=1 Tax=Persicimonas caeni TaxID=2292766 RepID=A0A4Y6PZU2_PERCE|nr:DUF6515 family protein [Persicimonas caeni]QDG53824.1 hypothetical protein FIV42_24685 [Persicimonas caeni]QED35045.1 hypothetical protein FRD00_24680 [Persicimonas caeni]
MSSVPRHPQKPRKWLRHLAAAALTFGMVGFMPDVVEVVTQETDTVEAQYGEARRVSRRTARRTSRRTTARQNYLYSLPAGYDTVVRAGTTYYVAGGTYYRPVHVDGQVAYVVADDID